MFKFKSYDHDTDEFTFKVHCPDCEHNETVSFSDIVRELGREPKDITIVDIVDFLHSKEYHWRNCIQLKAYEPELEKDR